MQGLLGVEVVESIAVDFVDLVDFWEPESTLRRFDLLSFVFLFADTDLYSLLADFMGIERNLDSSILGMTIYGSLRETSL
jgi:hypothetical protein